VTQPPRAEPGAPIDEVDTPALLIDLDALEYNLDHMGALAREAGVKLRPHAKTHKSPVIAHLQMARGAVGQCVQKVGEAEILAWGGVKDILVSNEVAGPRKLARFAALSRICTAAICVDSEAGVAALEAAAEDAGLRLTALIEIDVGMDRCGIPPGPAVTALAQRIAASSSLRFGGLQAYQGRAQHQRTPDERRASIARAVALTGETVADLKDAGLNCPIVGGAGTGTFALEAASGVYTELQVGSYVFMDADYAHNEQAPPFKQSLFVLTTVMSAPRGDLAVVDAGLKVSAMRFDDRTADGLRSRLGVAPPLYEQVENLALVVARPPGPASRPPIRTAISSRCQREVGRGRLRRSSLANNGPNFNTHRLTVS
jgi:3-hydroxy-D-aspartate aldolase